MCSTFRTSGQVAELALSPEASSAKQIRSALAAAISKPVEQNFHLLATNLLMFSRLRLRETNAKLICEPQIKLQQHV